METKSTDIMTSSKEMLPKQSENYTLEPSEIKIVTSFRNELRIAQYDKANLTELGRRLIAIAKSIGVTAPEKEQLVYLVDILKKQYSDFSMQEIALAFELLHAHILDVEVKHFNNFSATYVCPILNAYRDHRNKILAKQKQLERQKELADEKRLDIHDHELQKKSYENLLNFIQLNKKFPFGWNWEMVFHHMEREKLITDTNDEKKLFLENVIEDLREENTPKRFAELIEKETLKLECRKRRVKTYMEKYL